MVADNWPRDDLRPNQTGGSTGAPISSFSAVTVSGLARPPPVATIAGPATTSARRWPWYGEPRGTSRKTPSSVASATCSWIATYTSIRPTSPSRSCRSFTGAKTFPAKDDLAYARSLTLLGQVSQVEAVPGLSAAIDHYVCRGSGTRPTGLLEQVFGCPVFNRYGCREFAVIASECSEHQRLHVMSEGLYVEVVWAIGRPAGEIGARSVTDLLNLAMPMIRYRIGDMASYDDAPCPCGRGCRGCERGGPGHGFRGGRRTGGWCRACSWPRTWLPTVLRSARCSSGRTRPARSYTGLLVVPMGQ